MTERGKVLSGLDINGTVTVKADDVVIKNSRIRSTGRVPIRNEGSNLVIQDTEIDGQGQRGPAVTHDRYTLRRVNIHNIGEGPRVSSIGDVVIEDSFIHHLVQVGDNHTDALQATAGKNIIIRGNNVQAWNPDTRMLGNAAFQFGEEFGPVRNCLIEGNYMNGGNYTINGGGGGTRGAACTFRDNYFGEQHRYGVKGNLGPNVVWEENTEYEGAPPGVDSVSPKLTVAAPPSTSPPKPTRTNKPPTTVTAPPPGNFRQIVASPDLTGDGLGDVVAVGHDGRLYLYPGVGNGRVGSPRAFGTGWSSLDVYAPGDWSGDGLADLVAVDRAGNQWLYPGNGRGGLGSRSQIGNGWSGYRIVPAGDVDNNGTADLLAIDKRHRLWLYPGDGRGGFHARRQVGNGWKGFDLYAAGDMNADGKADILSIDAAGRLWFYAGRGHGYFSARAQAGYGWSGYGFASGADFNGDRVNDLIGRDTAGRLWFYPGRVGGTFAMKSWVGIGW